MPILWLDSSVVIEIANGDLALENELMLMKQGGTVFLYPPQVRDEVTIGNVFDSKMKPVSPEGAKANLKVLERLGATLDVPVDRMATIDNTGKGIAVNRKGVERSVLAEADSMVLSQISSSAKSRGISTPTFMTLDGGPRTQAKTWGITAITRTSVPMAKPGRPAIGAPSGPPASMGLNDNGMGSFILGAHAIIKNGLQKFSEDKAMEEALDEFKSKEPLMKRLLLESPGRGIICRFWFTFQPGVNRDMPDQWYFEGFEFQIEPGPPPEVMFEMRPRGEIKRTDIRLPPDPNARHVTPVIPNQQFAAVLRSPEDWMPVTLEFSRNTICGALKAAKISNYEFNFMDVMLGSKRYAVSGQLYQALKSAYDVN